MRRARTAHLLPSQSFPCLLEVLDSTLFAKAHSFIIWYLAESSSDDLSKLASSLPELPGTLFVRRAFELAEFILSKYGFAITISRQTRSVINHIVNRANSPWPELLPPTERDHRSRSFSNSPTYRFPQDWAVDKSKLRRDLTNFEFNTLYILRYIESIFIPSDLSG